MKFLAALLIPILAFGQAIQTGSYSRAAVVKRNGSIAPATSVIQVSSGENLDSAFTNATAQAVEFRLGPGTYTLNKEYSFSGNIKIVGAGIDKTILDFSSASGAFADNACLFFKAGGLTALTALSSSAVIHDTALTFASAPSVSSGDIIVIYNSANSSFNGARTAYHAGEINRVKSISGSVIQLDQPTYAAYASGSTVSVYKMSTISVDISNLSLKAKSGTGTLTGIKVENGYRCRFKDLRLYNTDYANLQLYRNFDSEIEGVDVVDYETNVSLNYGISIANSSRIAIRGCHLTTTRHGLTLGGDANVGDVPNREILVQHSTIGGVGVAGNQGLDMHGNVEFITFDGCHLLNGVLFAGDHTTIKNCRIRTSKDGIAFYANELLGFDHVIENNIIEATAPSAINTAAALFYCAAFTNLTRDSGQLVYKGNTHYLYNDTGVVGYIFNSDGTVNNLGVDISNNDFGSGVGGGKTLPFRIRCANGKAFGYIKISDNNKSDRVSWRLTGTNAALTEITGNHIRNAVAEGVLIEPNASPVHTTEIIKISENSIVNSYACGIQAQGSDSTTAQIFLNDNLSINNAQGNSGSASTQSSFLAQTFKNVVLRGNFFGDNQGVTTQDWQYYIAGSVTNVSEGGTFDVGSMSANHSETNRAGPREYDLQLTSTTDATAISTGSLQTAGGASILGNIWTKNKLHLHATNGDPTRGGEGTVQFGDGATAWSEFGTRYSSGGPYSVFNATHSANADTWTQNAAGTASYGLFLDGINGLKYRRAVAGISPGDYATFWYNLMGVDTTGVADLKIGYRIGGAATSGNFLRGNATNFVSSRIQSADVSDFISGSTNTVAKFTGANSLGNSLITDNGTTTNIADSTHIDSSLKVEKRLRVTDTAFFTGVVGFNGWDKSTFTPASTAKALLARDGAGVEYAAIAYNIGGGFNGLIGYAAAGGIAALTAIPANSEICGIRGQGYDGSAWIGSERGSFGIYAPSLWTTSNHVTDFRWRGTATGTTAVVNWMRLVDSTLQIGYTVVTAPTAGYRLDVAPSIAGAVQSSTIRNRSNTASAGARSYIEVAGTTANDPLTTWSIGSEGATAAASMGLDNSVSGDPLVISYSTTLGTTNIASSTANTWTWSTNVAPTSETFSNVAKTITNYVQYEGQTGTMSASRVVTLPASSIYPRGTYLEVCDESGTVTVVNTMVLTRAGADVINGATTNTISTAYGCRRLISDGTSKWTVSSSL